MLPAPPQTTTAFPISNGPFLMNAELPPGHARLQHRLLPDNRWLRASLAVLFALAMLRLFGWGNPVVEVLVEIRSQAGADGEIFYARAGEGYHPDRRVAFSINPDGRWHAYRVEIPEHRGLDRIRLDPGSASGIVEIRRISVEATGHSTGLAGSQLSAAMGMSNGMRAEAGNQVQVRFVATAPDPFVDFKLPEGAGVPAQDAQLVRWVTAAFAALLLWLLLAEFAWPLLARWLSPHLRMPKVLDRWAARLSDSGALVVPPQALGLVAVALCGATLYIALNLHQSSIGVWEELYPAKPVEQLVDLGTPKRIRSDEWNTQAPWVLGQVAEGKADHNASIGGEAAPLLASVPVANPSAIAQAKFYGFYLFDSETGFSWWWAYKTFGLGLAFFWLFLLLTRGNTVASVLGAVWVYGSSFTQWWLSSHLPELLIAFALATIGGIYLLFARRRIMVGVGAALVTYAVLNLLLHLYPPFIVPLAYLGMAILAGMMLEPDRVALVSNGLRCRVLCLGAAVLVVGLIGGNYLINAMPSIEAMANTSYPGRRISAGGDFPLVRLLYGYFEVFRIGENSLPLPPTNASEASSFIVLVPLLLLAIPFAALARRKNALLSALLLYCLVLGLWISVPMPRVVEAAMQAVGWSWSPPLRSVLGLGIGSIIAVTVLFARIYDGTLEVRPVAARWMVPVLVLSCLLLFGWALHGVDPVFFRSEVVLVASMAVATMAAGIVLGRAGLFAAGLAVAIAPALLVNPLVSGLSAIQDKPILLAAKRQGDAAGDRWAVVGDFVFSQGLKAQGLEVVTGSQLIPNRRTAQLLDPRGQYTNTWNRYAHVALRSDPGRASPVYELLTPDLYMVGMDICGPDVRRLGVTHVAYTAAVPVADLRCLTPLDAPADSGVRLFRLTPLGSTASP